MKITKRTHSARPPRGALQQKALENLKKFQAENLQTLNRSRELSELLAAAVKTGEITPTTAENALGRKAEFNKYRDIIGADEAFKVVTGKRAAPTQQQIAEISKLEGDARLRDRFDQGALDSKDIAKIAERGGFTPDYAKSLIFPPPPADMLTKVIETFTHPIDSFLETLTLARKLFEKDTGAFGSREEADTQTLKNIINVIDRKGETEEQRSRSGNDRSDASQELKEAATDLRFAARDARNAFDERARQHASQDFSPRSSELH